MGAGASSAALIEAECQRPLDASDVDAPEGTSAKDEVVRLRFLLAEHADALRDIMLKQQQKSEEREVLRAVANSESPEAKQRTYHNSGAQTDVMLFSSSSGVGWEGGSSCGEALGDNVTGTLLAPGIQEYLIACFTNADLDNSGVLSADEFSRLLREHVDLGLSPEDVQLLLGQTKWMDAKGDVTWQQFVQLAPQLLANLVDSSSPSQPSATDWCSCITPEGTAYYYNKRTQESAWEKPEELNHSAALTAPLPAVAAPAPAPTPTPTPEAPAPEAPTPAPKAPEPEAPGAAVTVATAPITAATVKAGATEVATQAAPTSTT